MLIMAAFQILYGVPGTQGDSVGPFIPLIILCCCAGECSRQGHPAVSAAGTVGDDGCDLEQVPWGSLSRHSCATGTLCRSLAITPFILGECDGCKCSKQRSCPVGGEAVKAPWKSEQEVDVCHVSGRSLDQDSWCVCTCVSATCTASFARNPSYKAEFYFSQSLLSHTQSSGREGKDCARAFSSDWEK